MSLRNPSIAASVALVSLVLLIGLSPAVGQDSAPEEASIVAPKAPVAPPTAEAPSAPEAPAASSALSAYGGAADETKGSFAAVTPEEIEASLNTLSGNAARFERMLGPARDGWLEYLNWDALTGLLDPDSGASPGAARATLQKLSSGADGLERRAARDLADSLSSHLAILSLAGVKDQQALFTKQVDVLGELLGKNVLDPRTSFEIERRMALLRSTGRGGVLLESLQDDYGQPNIFIDASADLLDRVGSRDVDEVSSIRETILGTRVRGTGHTTGVLEVAPGSSWESAQLLFTLNGTTNSSTRGVNGPVTICSSGFTTFCATQKIDLSNDGFVVHPAQVSARTKTKTRSVKKTGGGFGAKFIETIAKKKVAQKKGQSEAISSRKAEQRIAKSLSEQVTEKIEEAREKYDDRFHDALARRGAAPRSVGFSSDSEGVSIEITQAGDAQLAASGPPPEAAAGASVAVRVHQSAVNSLLEASLGGATIRKDAYDADTELVGAVAPKFLEDRESEPSDEEGFRPWAIRFRDGRAISFVFDEGRLKATIHAVKISVEEDSYDGWDLTAVFEPKVVDGKWALVREGQIDVLPTAFDPESGRGLPSKTLALRSNLVKAINEQDGRIPSEIEIGEIDLSDRDLAIEKLRLTEISLTDGWLSTGWTAE